MVEYELVIKNARVIDPALSIDAQADIAIANGAIAGIGDFSEERSTRSIDADGFIASPGWIDLHAHVFEGVTRSGVNADRDAGLSTGVTTVIDAGSSGAGTWDASSRYVIAAATTRVRAFMNGYLMPAVATRHSDWRNFDQSRTISLATRVAEAGRCLGITVLASQSHCGGFGLTPVQLAKQATRLSQTQMMVHIGNAPPVIEEVLALMNEGDIVTHC